MADRRRLLLLLWVIGAASATAAPRRPLARLRVLGLQGTRVGRTRRQILAEFPNLEDVVTD